jgi:hypothetical protein
VSKSDLSVTTLKPFGVTGEELDIKGRQDVSLEIDGRKFHHAFLVCPLPTEAAGVIGTDFFNHNKMDFADVKSTPRRCNKTSTEFTALTIFTRGKAHRGRGTRTSSSQPALPAREIPYRAERGS